MLNVEIYKGQNSFYLMPLAKKRRIHKKWRHDVFDEGKKSKGEGEREREKETGKTARKKEKKVEGKRKQQQTAAVDVMPTDGCMKEIVRKKCVTRSER